MVQKHFILRHNGIYIKIIYFDTSGFIVENDVFRTKCRYWSKFCFIQIPILIASFTIQEKCYAHLSLPEREEIAIALEQGQNSRTEVSPNLVNDATLTRYPAFRAGRFL
jgi:hypothetical protein